MRRLTLEESKEIIRKVLDLPTTHMRSVRGVKELYVHDLGNLQIAVSPSEGFGEHDIGEFIQVDIVLFDQWITLLLDWETYDRDLLAEQEYKNGER